MAAQLIAFSTLAVMASAVAAQSVRPLSTADSTAVIRGAVRAALAPRPDTRPICVTFIGDSLATAAGRAFIAEGRAVAGKIHSANDSAARLGITLVALSGGDTARVVIRLDGDAGWYGRTSFMNKIEYDFTRDASPGSWRLIAHRGLYFADYLRDDSSRSAPPSCINGRR